MITCTSHDFAVTNIYEESRASISGFTYLRRRVSLSSVIRTIMSEQEDYVFFWKINEVQYVNRTSANINNLVIQSGWGSQWYKSEFTVKLRFEEGGEEEEVTFPSAEHWMMVRKALLFGDAEKAREILGVPDDMGAVKALGRQVRNFDEAVWVGARQGIVLEGNMHKFGQNEELRAKLLATGTRRLVEASPRDRVWGIGFGARNALKNRGHWGLNLLRLETRRLVDRGKH